MSDQKLKFMAAVNFDRPTLLMSVAKLYDEREALQSRLDAFKILPIKWTNSFVRPRQKPTPESVAWDTCITDVMAALKEQS